MTAINATLQRWFTQRLINEQHVSGHTISAYRDTIRLLLGFTHDRDGLTPCELDFGHLDATVIGAFLTWLETDRHVSVATRNARLAALRSFFTYASFHHPEHAHRLWIAASPQSSFISRNSACVIAGVEITIATFDLSSER